MGQVITVMNMKGGVGKTTVAAHIGGSLGLRIYGKPRKILIIDYDPQFNLSQAFIPAKQYFAMEKARQTCLAILMDDDTDLDPFELQVPGSHTPPKLSKLVYNVSTHSGGAGKLDILPSTLDLMYVALGTADKKTKPMEERFGKIIEAARKEYDLIFIDCHPAGSLLTKTSLKNSDHVLIPVNPESLYAVRGIGLMTQFIQSKSVGASHPVPHILFNRTKKNGVSKQENDIRAESNFTKHCMNNTLKHYGAFAEPEGGKGFVWVSSKPYSNQAWKNLTAVTFEFINRIGA